MKPKLHPQTPNVDWEGIHGASCDYEVAIHPPTHKGGGGFNPFKIYTPFKGGHYSGKDKKK